MQASLRLSSARRTWGRITRWYGQAGLKAALIISQWLFATLLIGYPGAGHAQSPIPQPAIALGTVSFLDGEGKPGFVLETIGNGYQAWHLNDANGTEVPGRNLQSIASVAFHPIYVSNFKLLGGNLGFDAVVPIVYLRNDFANADNSAAALGDITLSPQIQWSGLSLFDRPFSMRVGLQFVAPTGSYDRDRPVNVGQNVWQISPYYAFTWRATDRWEVSGRLIYDWSSVNHDLQVSTGAQSAQPGDQLGFNFATSYAVSEQWRLGVGGYVLQQLSDTRVSGTPLANSKQRVVGVGPGLLWSSPQATVIANVYKEFSAQNRPEGYQAVLRLITPF